MKIVILDGFTAVRDDLNWDALNEIADLTAYDSTPAGLTVERCLDAEMVLTNKVLITAEVISQLPKLKYIGVLATGYNVVDCKAAADRGIIVTNIPAYSSASVAQIAISHLLNVTCRTDHYARENRNGRWTREEQFCYLDFPFTELSGKQMAIIGFGNIGSAVARIAAALGMKVVAVTSKSQEMLPEGVTRMEMDEALASSNVISLHCPLTDGTRHMINADSIRKMRSDAIVINTSRGPLVDDEAMAAALHDGVIAAYCTDVIAQEPPASGNPLFSEPNAFTTPHIGWASREARTRLVRTAVENVKAFLAGSPVNVVN